MDRRRFLSSGGVALAGSLAAGTGHAAASRTPADARLFRRVDFTSDGLGLDPQEYAQRLQEVVTRRNVVADYYSNGGTIAQLEQTFAQLLGKPAAMFVPTGTLANHLAIRALAGQRRRVLVQADSHLYNDSGDGAQTLSDLNLVPLAPGQAGFSLEDVQAGVARASGGRVRNDIGALSIENPVRRHDHVLLPFAELERISAYARTQDIGLHLDGARLFTLPLHSGKSVQDYTALFDTVYVSLWKHFNGVSGAILAGPEAVIDGLYHTRRMFGGSSHEAWPLVAVAADHADGFQGEYAKAWHAADALIRHLNASGKFKARKLANGTSRFFLSAPGVEARALVARARDHDIVLPTPHPQSGEFPLQVNPTLLRVTPEALAQRLVAALPG
ncbi:MAG: beta-eliminating lyase-related protein [Pseudoxanthomonas sp.]